MKTNFFLLFLICLLLSACARPASTDPTTLPANGPAIQVEQVEVTQGAGIRVSGFSRLPEGECVQTALLIDEQPAGWWPEDVCVEPDAGQWELVVALARDDAPAALDPQADYAIEAWSAGLPGSRVRFPLEIE